MSRGVSPRSLCLPFGADLLSRPVSRLLPGLRVAWKSWLLPPALSPSPRGPSLGHTLKLACGTGTVKSVNVNEVQQSQQLAPGWVEGAQEAWLWEGLTAHLAPWAPVGGPVSVGPCPQAPVRGTMLVLCSVPGERGFKILPHPALEHGSQWDPRLWNQ